MKKIHVHFSVEDDVNGTTSCVLELLADVNNETNLYFLGEAMLAGPKGREGVRYDYTELAP